MLGQFGNRQHIYSHLANSEGVEQVLRGSKCSKAKDEGVIQYSK
jgi:hypothetical protein